MEVEENQTAEIQETELLENTDVITDETKTDNAEVEEETVITIGGDEDSPASEDDTKQNPWEAVRKLSKENKRLMREAEKLKPKEQAIESAPERPTLEGSDYDEDDYAEKMEQYYTAKSKFDQAQAKTKEKEQSAQQEWQGKLDTYQNQKKTHNVSDDDEQVVLDELSEVQQGIIVSHAKDAGLLVLALGKNPKKAKELGSIKNPIDFAFAMAELEASVKVTKRTPPKPETKLGVSSRKSGGDTHLDKLREEAASSGDYSKVTAYKRSLITE